MTNKVYMWAHHLLVSFRQSLPCKPNDIEVFVNLHRQPTLNGVWFLMFFGLWLNCLVSFGTIWGHRGVQYMEKTAGSFSCERVRQSKYFGVKGSNDRRISPILPITNNCALDKKSPLMDNMENIYRSRWHSFCKLALLEDGQLGLKCIWLASHLTSSLSTVLTFESRWFSRTLWHSLLASDRTMEDEKSKALEAWQSKKAGASSSYVITSKSA